MDRERTRQMINLSDSLHDIIGHHKTRSIWGTLSMKDGREWWIDDYVINGRSVSVIRSLLTQPVITVPLDDIKELREQKGLQTGREKKFGK